MAEGATAVMPFALSGRMPERATTVRDCPVCPSWVTACVHFNDRVIVLVERDCIPVHPPEFTFEPIEAAWQVAFHREGSPIHCDFCGSREIDYSVPFDSEANARAMFDEERDLLRERGE